ncbi:hypothetical protein B0T26DRAFT_706384 [Lasiosphaeria miniovina]|uniref:Uncharacterized protein n=1 Tax=Lasiosphaeria miniovina TaxID=1954250 RepID=A0AA40AWU3_9PEZI|nr:uncharacterized protein B0T26DRAFT_706384 [Lasiosphaeria miniovina]KAK0723420.1 hypothetical protein B0T26DRAFT_706384 [Lasiosphaeria miniovina]
MDIWFWIVAPFLVMARDEKAFLFFTDLVTHYGYVLAPLPVEPADLHRVLIPWTENEQGAVFCEIFGGDERRVAHFNWLGLRPVEAAG